MLSLSQWTTGVHDKPGPAEDLGESCSSTTAVHRVFLGGLEYHLEEGGWLPVARRRAENDCIDSPFFNVHAFFCRYKWMLACLVFKTGLAVLKWTLSPTFVHSSDGGQRPQTALKKRKQRHNVDSKNKDVLSYCTSTFVSWEQACMQKKKEKEKRMDSVK